MVDDVLDGYGHKTVTTAFVGNKKEVTAIAVTS